MTAAVFAFGSTLVYPRPLTDDKGNDKENMVQRGKCKQIQHSRLTLDRLVQKAWTSATPRRGQAAAERLEQRKTNREQRPMQSLFSREESGAL